MTVLRVLILGRQDNHRLIALRLRQSGMETDQAANLDKMCEMLAATPYDAVVAGVQLEPDENNECPGVKLIRSTGFSGPIIGVHGERCGNTSCDRFVAEPVTKDNVTKAILDAMGRTGRSSE